jgi:hypothetical protein
MADTHLSDRTLIRISGEDVRGFLQGLVTQDLARVAPDQPQWAALLTAQGKTLFDFLLWADDEDILVDCEAAAAEDLTKRLTIYRLRRPIAIAREETLAVHWSPDASDQPTDPRLAALGHRWLAPASDAADASAAWRAHRLALGVTEGVAELGSDKTLWLECNAGELSGVDFNKGCYVGQENTARMHYRNKVNRRLVVVPLGEADERRQRIAYPELGLSVEHRRIEDMADLSPPDWLAAATA